MADIKISALPEISATGLTTSTVVASVNSGNTTTSKVTLGNLFNNRVVKINDLNPGNYNTFISAGSNTNSPTFGSEFRGNTRNSVIMNNGVINNGSDSFVFSTVEAAGGNWSGIDGANVSFVGAAFRSRINGGQECGIIGSQDATINNNYDSVIAGCAGATINGSGPSFMGGCQGGTINGNRAVMLGSEANTINSNMSGMYNSYGSTVSGNLYNVALGSYVATVNALGGAMENGIHIGSRESTINHQRVSMVSTSGRTSQYSGTTHVDGLYAFERIQSETNVTTTVSSVQTLSGGLGMVQYTDVLSGNLNLQINDVRNGEVYHWVIDNKTGGSISLNTVATNTGYAITDNSSNTLTTGPHIYTIVVVNNLIIIEGTH